MAELVMIFDFDGPLFDGRTASMAAVRRTEAAFADALAPATGEVPIWPLYGPRRLIPLLFGGRTSDAALIDRMIAHYREALCAIEPEQGMLPAVVEQILALHRAGVRLAILSLRPEAEMLGLLAVAGVREPFDLVLGRDSFSPGKPDPAGIWHIMQALGGETATTCLIGDSDNDYLAANGAGIAYYHADWAGEPNAIARVKAKGILGAPADLGVFAAAKAIDFVDTRDPPPALEAAIGKGEFSLFAGAGISVPSGLGGWSDQYEPIIQRHGGALIDEEHDLPGTLQLMAAMPERAKALFDDFKQSFVVPTAQPSVYHRALIRARARRIWTLNYDQLFEAAAAALGADHHVVTDDEGLLRDFDAPHLVIKVNGDFEHARYDAGLDWNIVFTEEQFDLAERSRREIMRLLEDEYRNNAILFVGLSFRDAALRRVLAAAARGIPKTRHRHYLLTRMPGHPLEAYRFEAYRRNLLRRNIETLFFRDFAAIERFVAAATLKAMRPIVGFTGTTANEESRSGPDGTMPNARLTNAEIEGICTAAGRALAKAGFRVCSGHGRGVGVGSVNGAFEEDPLKARFYLRRRGRSNFSRTAAAIVVPGDSLEGMRARFLADVDLLVAVGGETVNEGSSGTVAEIEMALASHKPVLILPQAGGDAAAFRDRLIEQVGRLFQDEPLRRAILDANDAIAAVAPADLPAFMRDRFAGIVEDVLVASVTGRDPHPRDRMAWPDW